MPTWEVNAHEKLLNDVVLAQVYINPYLWVLAVWYCYVKNECALWCGSELLTLINLTWSSSSRTFWTCWSHATFCLLLPLTCPSLPFNSLPVWPVTNGTNPQFITPHSKTTGFRPDHLGHWKLFFFPWIPSDVWPTHGPFSAWGRPCTHHASYPVRVRGHTVQLISYIRATYGQASPPLHTYKYTLSFVLSNNKD